MQLTTQLGLGRPGDTSGIPEVSYCQKYRIKCPSRAGVKPESSGVPRGHNMYLFKQVTHVTIIMDFAYYGHKYNINYHHPCYLYLLR